MNEDGSLGIPHGAPSEEETPSEAPIAPNAAEELLNNSANTSTENQLDISHDTPIENQAVPVNSEPIDIFAQQGAIAPNDMAPESNISEDTPTSFNATLLTPPLKLIFQITLLVIATIINTPHKKLAPTFPNFSATQLPQTPPPCKLLVRAGKAYLSASASDYWP